MNDVGGKARIRTIVVFLGDGIVGEHEPWSDGPKDHGPNDQRNNADATLIEGQRTKELHPKPTKSSTPDVCPDSPDAPPCSASTVTRLTPRRPRCEAFFSGRARAHRCFGNDEGPEGLRPAANTSSNAGNKCFTALPGRVETPQSGTRREGRYRVGSHSPAHAPRADRRVKTA
ncbi:hypothetical protein TBK1r_46650 [Stieleria magnilauensis]|uniref:Uncharacterized protein n=1 Tax=Stieleria magnilauensis TaxID=2527963 RepID=A0ABX5XUD7_9BACT|nr:hypothetical protein TBK1r_46650 [Planctomycetes bacterium TBK1r]